MQEVAFHQGLCCMLLGHTRDGILVVNTMNQPNIQQPQQLYYIKL